MPSPRPRPRPPLTPDQQRLVGENTGLAYAAAFRWARWLAYRHGHHLGGAAGLYRHADQYHDEIIGAALEGLCVAAGKFDPARGNQFSTMAVRWIEQAIQKERPFLHLRVGPAYNGAQPAAMVYLLGGGKCGQGDERDPLDVPDDRGDGSDPAAGPSPELLRRLAEALSTRECRVLCRRLFDGMTLDAAARLETPPLTRERVRQIELRALRRLRESRGLVRWLRAQAAGGDAEGGLRRLLVSVGTRIA
jgi:hypothetical protein